MTTSSRDSLRGRHHPLRPIMPAFVPPTPLRLTPQRSNRCQNRAQSWQLALSESAQAPAPGKQAPGEQAPGKPTPGKPTPGKPTPGKRIPSYKKLQRRHRQGPKDFRRAQNEQQQQGQKSADEEPLKHRRPRTGRSGTPLRELAVDQSLSGIVQNVVPHGAFVDVGATRDGLVHVRDMAVDFVHTPLDVVRSGMKVQVWVKYVDPVRDVLALTMVRPAMGFEGRTKISDVEVGSRHHGVLERVTNYGAYIDIGAERLAFLHVSGVWGESPRDTLEYMRLGDRVWVSVIDVDELKGHIRLFARGKGDERLKKDEVLEEVVVKDVSEKISPDMVVARPSDVKPQEMEGEDTKGPDDVDEIDDIDDGDVEESDEFGFVNEDVEDATHYRDLGEVAHMFNSDTEFVDMVVDE